MYTDAAGHRDEVRVKLQEKYMEQPSDISKIWVRNNRGELIPLSEVVTIEETKSLLTITRYNRERAISIYANVAAGKSQSVAIEFIENLATEILPAGYHITLSGSSEAFRESFQSLIAALVLGIFVAYMVLGAQFNSFVHPLAVLLALPFSVTGAFIALRVTGSSLNIYSLIGILLLMGIVKKNSILLVDFTNQRRTEGLGVHDALIEACPLRLRPILMTSIATIAAAIPAALSLGPGAETFTHWAFLVIGGVLLYTLLSILVVPCVYCLLYNLQEKKRRQEVREAIEI
jgi:multidrug efflux pump subunit AcrB